MATYGSNIADGDFNFVKINSQTDEVERIYNEKVMNFAIDNNNIAYLYNYNYNTEASSIKVLNLRTGETIRRISSQMELRLVLHIALMSTLIVVMCISQKHIAIR